MKQKIVLFAFLFFGLFHCKTLLASSCPRNFAPTFINAVLIDISDPLNEPAALVYERTTERLLSEVPHGGRLDIYFIRVDTKSIQPPTSSFCKPLIPPGGGQVYWERRIRKTFLEPGKQALMQALQATASAETSPIIESIYNISLTSFVGSDGAEIPGKLIVISDFLQNSQLANFYRQPLPSFKALRNSADGLQWLRSSKRTGIELILIPSTPNTRTQQSTEFQRFWVDYATDLFCDNNFRLLKDSVTSWRPNGCN